MRCDFPTKTVEQIVWVKNDINRSLNKCAGTSDFSPFLRVFFLF